jgi:transposase
MDALTHPWYAASLNLSSTTFGYDSRRCHTLHEDHPYAAFARQVQTILQQALDVRDRRDAQTMSAHGVAVARGHLLNRLNRLTDTPGLLADNRRFAAYLSVEFPGIFTFLFDPRIDATNWRAEQAIRPAVVTREVCGRNRMWAGVRTQQVLGSVVRTAHERQLDTADIFTALLLAPKPFVPASLQTPT